MGNKGTDIRVSPAWVESGEAKPEKKSENIKKSNKAAEEQLRASKEEKALLKTHEEKPKWTLNTLGITGGGDGKLNMISIGPTLTSPNGEARITAGYTSSSERPDSGMNASSKDGVWFNVNMTIESFGRGLKKIGGGIKNMFNKKK